MSEEQYQSLTEIKVVLWNLWNSMDDVQQYAQKRVLRQEVDKLENLTIQLREEVK